MLDGSTWVFGVTKEYSSSTGKSVNKSWAKVFKDWAEEEWPRVAISVVCWAELQSSGIFWKKERRWPGSTNEEQGHSYSLNEEPGVWGLWENSNTMRRLQGASAPRREAGFIKARTWREYSESEAMRYFTDGKLCTAENTGFKNWGRVKDEIRSMCKGYRVWIWGLRGEMGCPGVVWVWHKGKGHHETCSDGVKAVELCWECCLEHAEF